MGNIIPHDRHEPWTLKIDFDGFYLWHFYCQFYNQRAQRTNLSVLAAYVSSFRVFQNSKWRESVCVFTLCFDSSVERHGRPEVLQMGWTSAAPELDQTERDARQTTREIKLPTCVVLNLYISDGTEDRHKHLDRSKSLPPGTHRRAPPGRTLLKPHKVFLLKDDSVLFSSLLLWC